MPHLLDSDRTIDWLANAPDALALIDALSEEGVFISIITYIEAYQGTLLSRTSPETSRLLRIRLEQITILDLTFPIARRCAEIREALRLAGKKSQRRSMDLIIAATAIEHGLTLVTRNTGDYSDIPGILLHAP